MKIFFNAELPDYGSVSKPVPPHLKHLVFKWAHNVYYFEEKWGYFLIQEYISGDIKLYSRKANFKKNFTFYTTADKPSVVLQFQLNGSLSLNTAASSPVELYKGEFGFLYFPDKPLKVNSVPGPLESLHFEINETLLKELAKANSDAKILLENMEQGSRKGVAERRMRIDDTVEYWLKRIFKNEEDDYNFSIELMFSLLKIIKIYHNVSKEDVVAENVRLRPVYPALVKIRKDISAHPDKRRFTLQALSGEYLFSEQLLRIAFKEVFNESISNCLHRNCMQRAYYWLENTDWTVGKIADELGYENKLSLSHAIYKWFKKTPEQIRRNIVDDDD